VTCAWSEGIDPSAALSKTSHIRTAAVHEVHRVGVLGDVVFGEAALERREVDVDVPREMNLAVLTPLIHYTCVERIGAHGMEKKNEIYFWRIWKGEGGGKTT